MNTSPSPQQILVCDDEPHLREMVAEYLTERGYCVSEAENANVMNDLLEKTQPALIILDVNMPGTDGLTALRNLRTTSTVPVIMLTAASEVVDRIVGLEMGADDYVGKPVDLRELEARIKAALRRQSFVETESEQRDRLNGTVPFGPCRLDIDGAKLFGADGNEIAITAMEFSLLRVFAETAAAFSTGTSCWNRLMTRVGNPLTAPSTSGFRACVARSNRTRPSRRRSALCGGSDMSSAEEDNGAGAALRPHS